MHSTMVNRPALIEFVDFKWLMVGEGHHIDVDRLQRDHAYARGCVALASGSRSPTLRLAAERMREALQLPH